MNNLFGQYPRYETIVDIPELGIDEGDIIVFYKDNVYNITDCKKLSDCIDFNNTKYFTKVSDWTSNKYYGMHIAVSYDGKHQFDAILCDDNPEEMLLAPDDHIRYPDYVTLKKIDKKFRGYSFKEISYYYYVNSDGTIQRALVGTNESQDYKRKEIGNYFDDKTIAKKAANMFVSMLKSIK
jgi:hypothetical protein